MIRRLDAWIGKHLMQPPIIWVCQRVGINQYAFYRYGWWLVAVHAVAFEKPWTGLWWFAVLFAIARTVSAGAWLDRPRPDAPALRMILLVLLAMGLVDLAFGEPALHGTISNLTALVAEYALTITTIPPRKTEERARKLKLARLSA